MEPIAVEVIRGALVEAIHRVHAVAVRDGRIELAADDPGRLTFLRSSAKPIQALPVVRACPDLSDEEIVLCCASHLARPDQVTIVEQILAKAGATAADLECGPESVDHNCSGKHAGFIRLAATKGWPRAGYRLREHPVQVAIRHEVAAATGLPESELVTGIDGCGVPTYGVSLRVAAGAFVRLRSLDGAERVLTAMGRHPELLSGPVAADALAIGHLDGWVAKGGAEGLFCASSPDGLGIALKVEDGSFRAILPALAWLLDRLGIRHALPPSPIDNARGELVGEIRAR